MNTEIKLAAIGRWLRFAWLTALTLGIVGLSQAGQIDGPAKVGFNDQIRPIFNRHCAACHGGVKQASDISFAYRDQVLPPNGWIVEPGDPEASILIERVTSDDPEERMPPAEHGPPLSKQEIELLTQWIEQGANWNAHWAYTRPIQPDIPNVAQPDWCLQPLDNFVIAKLENEKIAPSPDATPERWLRRVTLDLIGLPPSPDERTAFLQDVTAHGEAAYSRVVDRLLDSPQYGERWASVWLDQVRYADSKGLGADGRRNIWKYRDWVISAFNRDLPFDEFTTKQIAGDLLPNPTIEDWIATAAHRLTQTNEEGGTDDEEFRVAAVLDRVNTTWQTWQGVTFACVQCHSHPYDPFRHEEYYQFAAFFNNTTDCDLNEDWPVIQAPLDQQDYIEAGTLERKTNVIQDKIWRLEHALLANKNTWQSVDDMQAATSNATDVEVERKANHEEFFTVDTVSKDTDITLEAALPENLPRLTAIRFTAMPLQPGSAVADSEWGFVLSHVEAFLLVVGQESPQPIELSRVIGDESNPFYDPVESLNPKSNQGFGAYTRVNFPRESALVLSSPLNIPQGSRLRLTLKHRIHLLASFSLITRRGHIAVTDDLQFARLGDVAKLNSWRKELADLKLRRSKIKSTAVPVLQERDPHLARPSHVFVRGLFLTKGLEVEANTPESLPPLPANMPANRLALASWLVSPDNPLTARVAVNRLWAQLFGIGLVSTQEDFGSSGEAPSHPKLLDFLATRFQTDHRWSIKQTLREMVLSHTYRQSSKIRTELLTRDPNNRLLARGPRPRLPAETVRDQSLAVAGLLTEKMFGSPVYPPIPAGAWQPFSSNDKWDTAEVGNPNRYRRSIYTYTKRSIPYPMLATFDAPSREFCVPRRLRSNTPLQALMALNDETFIECAAALGQRMRSQGGTEREQFRYGFLLVTCREPTESELDELIALSETLEEHGSEAILQNVAAVLLNLDEVFAK